MNNIFSRIKSECGKHDSCYTCPLCVENGSCLVVDATPQKWDTDAICKALGEESLPIESFIGKKFRMPIAVPKKLPGIYKEGDKIGYIDEIARWKIDEVIDCLEQIKERLDGED